MKQKEKVDLDQQEQNKEAEFIIKLITLLEEVHRELISRSGMIKYNSYPGYNCLFDVILDLTAIQMQKSWCTVIQKKDQDLLDAFSEEFINQFMINQHKIIVKSCKFNWNWD